MLRCNTTAYQEVHSMFVPTRLAYSINEAAELLSVSQQQLRRMAKRGELRVARIGEARLVVPADELMRLLATADDDATAEKAG